MLDYETLAIAFEETLKRKDPYDHHGRNVSLLVITMAKLARCFSDDEMILLKWGTHLHDIGKVFIPDNILNHPGKLTEAMMSHVQTHVHMGWDLARSIGCHPFVLDIIHCHHENENGTGYPRRLKTFDIPRAAQFTRVADTYDALHNDRIYRKAWPDDEIFMFLDAEVGEIFNADAVHFLKMAVVQLEEKENEH
jgi:HD-GYP domain-containing protein (c-di-GMP phosphodiesterase class II)